MSNLNKRNPLAKAVKLALLASATVSALSAPAVFAAEEEEDARENRVVVTGSRIKRMDTETMQPVTIITREELDLSGDTSVADALRNTSSNSFGSWKGQSGYGSGATGSAEIDLRGVGATLVLLDGRRMPGVGYDGGGTQNLNNIPLAIVERIEILRGGASAIYGSDAIAGVVNIITRKDVEGANASVTYEKRGIDDGTRVKYEFSAGVSDDKSSMLFVVEHTSVDEMADNSVSGFDNGISWYSPVANAFYRSQTTGGYTSYYDGATCETVPNTVDQGYRCGYAYSNVTWLFPKQSTDSVWTKYTRDLTDNIEFNARIGFVQTKTQSRFAPTPVSTNTLTMQFDNPNAPADIVADIVGDPNIYIYTRTALLGNRDSYFRDTNFDVVLGLTGFIDEGAGFDWEVNYQRTVKNENLRNTNLVNDLVVQQGINDGSFDVFNAAGLSTAEWSANALDFYRTAAHTGTFEVEQIRDTVDGNISGEIMSNDTMTMAFVVGGEYEVTDFTQISDPESGQGFISGGSGGDDVFANRDRTSAYTELAMNFDFGLELSGAMRYDKYDQTGDIGLSTANRTFSDITTMFSAGYRPIDSLLVRASVGEAFRAPTMPELFASNSFGFPSGYDYYYCDTANGGQNGLGGTDYDSSYCDPSSQPQHLTFTGGNPSLSPENADTINAGIVWSATDDLILELDYYAIEYFDKITNVSVNTILLQDNINGGVSDAVTRASNGQVLSIQGGTLNLARQETSGLDFLVSYNMETEYGRFVVKADATRVINYINVQTEDDGTEIRNDLAGRVDFPEFKGNVTTSWSQGDYYAAWRMNYIGSQESQSDNFRSIDSTLYHNIQFGLYTSWEGEVVVGIKNVTDEQIQMYTDDVAWRNYNPTLYNPEGRTWFVRYEQNF